MKKVLITFFLTFLLLGMLLHTPLILAEENNNSNNSGSSGSSSGNSEDDGSNNTDDDNESGLNETNDDGDENETENNDKNRTRIKTRELIRDGNCTIKIEKEIKIEDGRRVEVLKKKRICDGLKEEIKIRIEKRTDDGSVKEKIKYEFKGKEMEVETEEGIELEEKIDGEEYKLKARFRGNSTEIKIMPNTASEIAIERLKTLNFTIELREVSTKGNVSRIVYHAKALKDGRFIGIFKLKVKIEGQIDPETGEIIRIKKSWWAFLVRGEDSDQTGKKTTLCHIPPGDPGAKQTISVGNPAVAAHLAHGDTLGECNGTTTPPGNETNQTLITLNLTEQNNSSESGTATLLEGNGTVTITINVSGAPENVSQPAHIHNGSCPDVGAVKYALNNIINGSSTTIINATFNQLESELPLAINIHQSVENSSIYVSCGDIQF